LFSARCAKTYQFTQQAPDFVGRKRSLVKGFAVRDGDTVGGHLVEILDGFVEVDETQT
jgi:hypothetical protein